MPRDAPSPTAMDSFLTACGATAPLTLEIEGPGFPVPERRVFSQPYVLVGRDDRADLVLDHDAVSRRHAYLQVVEGRVFFIDLDSRAGTSTGESQAEVGWLVPGQGIEIGSYTVRHVPFPGLPPDTPTPPNPLLARSSPGSGSVPGPGDLPRVTLEFQSRSAGHSVWRMSQVLALVGSAPRCKVRLFDSQVSKLHCALIRTPGGLWVVDLLSRGGITVNGVATRGGQLNPGDSLGLGQVVVRPSIEDGPAPRQATAAPAVWQGREPAAGWTGQGGPAPLTPAPSPGAGAGAGLPPMPPGLGGLAVGELASKEPALALLLSHFGQMQQQMMDQFQQSMMMMLQMFGGMHREQMGLVREELDRLRELNDEIAEIKAEMAQRSGPPAGARPMPPHAQPSGGQLPAFDAYGRPLPSNGGRLPAWPNTNVPPWSASTARPARGHAPEGPPFRPAAPAQGPRTPPEPAAPPGDPSADVHDWLNDRLNAITTEQQNRWRKIMTMIRGEK